MKKNLDILLSFHEKIPANFRIQKETSVSQKRRIAEWKYIDLLISTNDLRAVPKLLKFADSDKTDSDLKKHILDRLTFHYPGVPGLNELLLREMGKRELSNQERTYLSKRFKHIKPVKTNKKALEEAREYLKNNNKEEASKIYTKLISGDIIEPYGFYVQVSEYLDFADEKGKAEIKPFVLKQCRKDVNGLSTFYAEEALKVMRKMNDPDFLEPLIDLSKRVDSSFLKLSFGATATLYKMAAKDKKNAVKLMVDALPKINFKYESLPYLMNIWLLYDGEEMINIPKKYADEWQELEDFLKIKFEQGIEWALIAMLRSEKFRRRVTFNEWVYFFCGELKAKSAVSHLLKRINFLKVSNLDQKIPPVLAKIGGKEVELGLEKMISEIGVRFYEQSFKPIATKALIEIIDEEKFRKLFKKSLQSPTFGSRREFYFKLGAIGTPKDLPLLLQQCDFWRADKKNLYSAKSAVIRIWDRYNYDLNGKVERR